MHGGNQQLDQRVGDLQFAPVNQRREQRQRQRLRVAAQMRRRFDCGPRPPLLEDLRYNIREQACRQIQGPDRLQLVDLGHHRLQAHIAWAGLGQDQQRRRRIALVIHSDGDQGQQATCNRRTQPAGDPRRPVLFRCAQSRPNHTQDPPGRRRLDP